jgi:SMODS-associated and fused to various effectors sensor domain/TIR domain
MMSPLTSMVSYSWEDASAGELLHEELALRGLTVFHDRCTFATGGRIGQNMADAVETCDSFVAYLTPSSLYEKAPAGPRPALDDEFLPVMNRLTRARGSAPPSPRPVVLALTHGLGEPRKEAPERVRKATGRDISSLWTPVTLDQTTPEITQGEAATAAGELLRALLRPGAVDGTTQPLEIAVVTRGEGQPPRFLTINATTLLGGRENRAGSAANWARFLTGLHDLQATLAAWGPQRQLRVGIKAHLSAAIAFGRVFNQAANWSLYVAGRYGEAVPCDADGHPQLKSSFEKGARHRDLAVEIDLLDVRMSELADRTLASLHQSVPNRLCIWRDGRGDLGAIDVTEMASAAARIVRSAVFDLQPAQIHMFCAAPVEFGVLLGRKLTALHCNIALYERDTDLYAPSLTLAA